MDNKAHNTKKFEYPIICKIIVKTLIFGNVDSKIITSQEEPSYISGIQKCRGKIANLKNKDKLIKTKEILIGYKLKPPLTKMSFKFSDKPVANIKDVPSKNNPEDKAPRIKYFNPASEPLIEILFLEINTNREKVCSSKPK